MDDEMALQRLKAEVAKFTISVSADERPKSIETDTCRFVWRNIPREGGWVLVSFEFQLKTQELNLHWRKLLLIDSNGRKYDEEFQFYTRGELAREALLRPGEYHLAIQG